MPLLWSFIFYDLLWGYQFRTSSHFRDDSVTSRCSFGEAKRKHLKVFYQQGASGERCNKYQKFPNYITRLQICPLYIFRKQKPPQILRWRTTMDIKSLVNPGFGVDFFQGQNLQHLHRWLLSGSVCDLRIEQAIAIQCVKLLSGKIIRLWGIDEVEVKLYFRDL